MIEGYYDNAQKSLSAGNSIESCRPDPEKMLQRARERIAACDRATAMLMEIAEMPVDVNFGQDSATAFRSAIGSIVLCRLRNSKEEAMWLDEINKP